MKYRKEDDGRFIVALERGDDLHACVEDLAEREKIVGAELTAIGAVEDPELGYYDLLDKRYLCRTFTGIWEVVSLQGNLTMRDGKPFLHAHVALGGRDFLVYGGHLFGCRVGVVVEMIVRPFATALLREDCAEIGLARWEPHHRKDA